MSTHSHRGKRAGWRARRRENPFAAEGEKSLPEALGEIDAADEQAARARATAAGVPASVPAGAFPPEDIPLTAPAGTHPFGAPLTAAIREHAQTWRQRPVQRSRGTRHTEPFRPDFDVQGNLPRPYVPGNRPWLLPDTWRRHGHPLTQQGRDLAGFVQDAMAALAYPAPGAPPSEVAAFMRRVSVITGTASSFEQPARCTAWALAIECPASVAATGPQHRLTGPQFTPHARSAA